MRQITNEWRQDKFQFNNTFSLFWASDKSLKDSKDNKRMTLHNKSEDLTNSEKEVSADGQQIITKTKRRFRVSEIEHCDCIVKLKL